jgi:hypothetical protein
VVLAVEFYIWRTELPGGVAFLFNYDLSTDIKRLLASHDGYRF